MFLKAFIIFALCIGCRYTEANCAPCKEPPTHYKELKCTGYMTSTTDCCNTQYSCPEAPFKAYTDKCHLNGTFYRISEKVPEEFLPPCLAESICLNAEDNNGTMFFLSPRLPMSFGSERLPQYSLENICDPVRLIYYEEVIKLAKCFYYGTEYYQGQLFTPKGEQNACYKCICNEHFDNSTLVQNNEKICRKLNCGIEIVSSSKLKRGCVPVYRSDGDESSGGDESSCCPTDWLCPENNSTSTYLPKIPQNALTCYFGDKIFKHGEKMETGNKCRTCTCNLAPVLTCIEKTDC